VAIQIKEIVAFLENILTALTLFFLKNERSRLVNGHGYGHG
jgi:hypothetical protein